MSEYKDSAEQIVDDFAKDQQELELQNMLAKANNVVTGFVASTGATGLIPIPFADAPLLIAQQVAMMGAINAVFHITVGKDILKSLAMAAIGVSGGDCYRKNRRNRSDKNDSGCRNDYGRRRICRDCRSADAGPRKGLHRNLQVDQNGRSESG